MKTIIINTKLNQEQGPDEIRSDALTPGVSVIICCFNSSKRIETTLRYLSVQTAFLKLSCEIIVVNNASTDNLEEVVDRVWHDCNMPCPLRVIVEERPGLMYARASGVRAAKYSYGLFCDDDNWLSDNYILTVSDIFDTDDLVGVIGGASTPAFEISASPQFYSICQSYAVGIQSPQEGDISHRGYVWGAGMGFRTWLLKEIFTSSDISPILSGRTKNNLASGDDTEICSWYIFAGYSLFYTDKITFQHYIPQSRLETSYIRKLQSGLTTARQLCINYNYYSILKYGLFKHPKRESFLGLYPFIRRLHALFSLLKYPKYFSRIKKIDSSINKLKKLRLNSYFREVD